MRQVLLWCGVWALTSGPTAWAAPAGPVSLLVLNTETKGVLSATMARQLEEALVTEATSLPAYQVVSLNQVQALLSQEQLRQATGCDQESCALELAAALNSQQVVMSSVARVQRSWLITLTRMDARKALVLARATGILDTGGAVELIEAMQKVARALLTRPGVSRLDFTGKAPGSRNASEPGATPSIRTLALRVAGVSVGAAAAMTTALGVGLLAGAGGIWLVDLGARGFDPNNREHILTPWLAVAVVGAGLTAPLWVLGGMLMAAGAAPLLLMGILS